MRVAKGLPVVFSGGCMSLVWRYAWANFVTAAVFHRPYPLPEAIAAYVLAALFTSVSLGRGWRVIQILGLQLVGFLFILLRTVYVQDKWSHPFTDIDWLLQCVHRTRGPLEWLSLVLILCWVLLFWFGGVSLARKPKEYIAVCARFDLGVAFLFGLFLIKFLIRIKGGGDMQDPLSELLLLPFFLFGLLAIGLARNESAARRGFLAGYRGLGVFLSFSVVVLLFGTGLVLLFYPYLTVAAEAGYAVLKVAARPLAPVLIGILRFLFAPRRMKADPVGSSSGGDMPLSGLAADSSWWAGPWGEIVRFLLMSIAILAVLVMIGLALWLLFRWLFSRTPTDKRRTRMRSPFSALMALWRAFLALFTALIHRMGKRRRQAVHLYAALLGWGRRSGVSRSPCETPLEYGERLKQRFPDLGSEFASIVESFNREVYGLNTMDDRMLAPARSAWVRLRSPLQWPRRFKGWFFDVRSFSGP